MTKNDILKQIAKSILARRFEDMNDRERAEYLREHQESRWNPGNAALPRKKPKKKKS